MDYQWNINGIYQLIESDSQTLLAGKDLTSPSNMGIYIVIGLYMWFSLSCLITRVCEDFKHSLIVRCIYIYTFG